MNEELRRADRGHMELLFEWANDETVRQNSFSTRKITYTEHERWFLELLKKENVLQYIYYVDGSAVGQVRVTAEEEQAEIGYSIAAPYRGMGYAKRMLGLLRMEIKEAFPKVKKLKAKVKPENKASNQVFLNLGYRETYREYEIEV